jgi:hypothetical protein
MTLVRTLLIALTLSSSSGAQYRPAEIPLWPGGAPGSEGKTAKEVVTTSASGELSVAGIHNPSITPYLPAKEKATGLAILVIPGGGHRVLAITHEGYNVAEWLRHRRTRVRPARDEQASGRPVDDTVRGVAGRERLPSPSFARSLKGLD